MIGMITQKPEVFIGQYFIGQELAIKSCPRKTTELIETEASTFILTLFQS